MLVTLYCDASWSTSHGGTGGWGVWLRSDQGRIIRRGPCPDYCKHVFEAELAAIFAGLHLAVTYWPDTKTIVVRSDCRHAVNIVTGQQVPKEKHRAARRLRNKITKLRKRHKVRIIGKWVKGHQPGDKVDAYLNRRVDQLAGEAMRAEVVRRGLEPRGA